MPREYALTGRLPTAARPTISSASRIRRRRSRPAVNMPGPPGYGAAASMSERFAAADRCGYAAGPSTSAPTSGRTERSSRGIGRPSTSMEPLVA